MQNLSNLPLRKIFKKINYDDLMNLIQTPELRNIVLSYYQDDLNYRELEKRIIMDCIDDLQNELETNLFSELMDYFETKGYNVKSNLEYKNTMDSLYKDLLKFSEFDSKTIELIQKLQQKNTGIYDLSRVLKNWIENYPDVFNPHFEYYKNKLEMLENKYHREFNKNFFKGHNSYSNILEYLEKVKEYGNEFLVTDEEEVRIRNKFLKCVNDRLGKIKNIFGK
jgi:hypothetical protein